jgi:CRISPR/Cas system-associated protein Cas10 (large subunit of type III CRISPR-Cas system)
LKEFTVCYTLDNDIKREKIIKGLDVNREEIVQEILERLEHSKFFIVTNQGGDSIINSSLVRYVRVINEEVLVQI